MEIERKRVGGRERKNGYNGKGEGTGRMERIGLKWRKNG